MSPNRYDQLCMICGLIKGKNFPVVYALLSSKTEEEYQHMLQEILQSKADLNPISIIVDFELAAIIAFQNTFPNATLGGCMLYFSQCVWRKLQTEGFSEHFRNEPDFTLLVKQLFVLAFVPPLDVINLFEHLTQVIVTYRQSVIM